MLMAYLVKLYKATKYVMRVSKDDNCVVIMNYPLMLFFRENIWFFQTDEFKNDEKMTCPICLENF